MMAGWKLVGVGEKAYCVEDGQDCMPLERANGQKGAQALSVETG